MPNNPVSRADGIVDSVEAARTYLRDQAGNHFNAECVDAFLATGPEAIDFFERKTQVKFEPASLFSDYHPTAPGGRDGGRSIKAVHFRGQELGRELRRLRPPLPELTFVGLMIGSGPEVKHFFNVTRSVQSAIYVAGRLAGACARSRAERSRHAADQRQCARGPAVSLRARSRRRCVDRRAGRAAVGERRRGDRRGREARRRARPSFVPRVAWCSRPAAFRRIWRGAAQCLRMTAITRAITHPRPRAIQAMACGSAKKSARWWSRAFRTRPRGCRCRACRAAQAVMGCSRTSSIARSRASSQCCRTDSAS